MLRAKANIENAGIPVKEVSIDAMSTCWAVASLENPPQLR